MLFTREPIHLLTNKICHGQLTCEELVNAAYGRIKKCNTNINAFISLQPDRAHKRAVELDQLTAKEKKLKPLLGIPIAVKDNICTQNVQTTCASKMLSTFLPSYNATVIANLEQAGAIIVGKTNLDEFAMGSSTETSVAEVTRNPHDLHFIPGGSSGGSAAAVAASCVPISLGSDTGGSIRQPASHCGVLGLKPTYGRVSRYGLVAFASSLDQIGPFSGYAEDLGLLLSVIAGKDEKDATCVGKPFANDPSLYTESLKDLLIGIPKEYFGDGLTESVNRVIEEMKASLADAGAKFVEVSLPMVKYGIAAYYIICTAEASSNLARYDGVKFGLRSSEAESLTDMYKKTRQQGFGAEVKRRIMLGTYVLSSGYYDAYYLKAAKIRTLLTQDFNQAFSKCDVLISPVAPTPAFKIGEKCHDPLQMYLTDIYTVSANLAGIPGISVPGGKDGKLPIGVQFMAPKWREDILIKLAYAAQKHSSGGQETDI